jgi:hypothetical protein
MSAITPQQIRRRKWLNEPATMKDLVKLELRIRAIETQIGITSPPLRAEPKEGDDDFAA